MSDPNQMLIVYIASVFFNVIVIIFNLILSKDLDGYEEYRDGDYSIFILLGLFPFLSSVILFGQCVAFCIILSERSKLHISKKTLKKHPELVSFNMLKKIKVLYSKESSLCQRFYIEGDYYDDLREANKTILNENYQVISSLNDFKDEFQSVIKFLSRNYRNQSVSNLLLSYEKTFMIILFDIKKCESLYAEETFKILNSNKQLLNDFFVELNYIQKSDIFTKHIVLN